MNFSFWEKNNAETASDITILGSGIVGLSTAISLKEMDSTKSVKIIERAPVSFGASTKNAGFSCFGSVTELLDDIQQTSEAQCAEIVRMRWDGLQLLRKRVGDRNMEYSDCGGKEVFAKRDDQQAESIFDQVDYCNTFIEKAIGLKNCYQIQKNQSFATFHPHMITNVYEGSINPVGMMDQLIKQARALDIRFINGTNITEINRQSKCLIVGGDLRIPYQKLCVCTNGFTNRLLPELEVQPARNQVLITKPLQHLNWQGCFHFDKGYIYFRNYQNRILLGGARNLDPKHELTDHFGNTEFIQKALLKFLDQIHPGASAQVDHWWSGILGIGASKKPICQWIDQDILAGVRLGGMGVAIGSWLGQELAEQILK